MKAVTQEPFYLRHPIPVLYEDEHYMAFNKPAGVLVIPSPEEDKNTLVNIVNHQYAKGANVPRLFPCHRLDRDTSGVILFAKGKKAQQAMMMVFKQKRVKKNYIAFVQGHLHRKVGEMRGHIRKLESRRYYREEPENYAITRYKVTEQRDDFAIVSVEPVTGRTNQIRIQFSEMGHPLVGDRKYAIARDFALKFKRSALHAASVECINPLTKQRINITCNLPNDMEAFLARHRN